MMDKRIFTLKNFHLPGSLPFAQRRGGLGRGGFLAHSAITAHEQTGLLHKHPSPQPRPRKGGGADSPAHLRLQERCP